MIRGIRYATAIAALALSVTVAAAGVPDPRFSDAPLCIPTCPAGDLVYAVTVRDVNNSPLGNVFVALRIAGCPAAQVLLCSDCPELPGYDAVNKTFSRLTNASGIASFHICGTVFCPGGGSGYVEVSASGVVLRNATFEGPDVDHDLDVDAADVALVTAALGTVNQPVDQDCNAFITQADVDAVTAHVGHLCAGVTPAFQRSWGVLKATYS